MSTSYITCEKCASVVATLFRPLKPQLDVTFLQSPYFMTPIAQNITTKEFDLPIVFESAVVKTAFKPHDSTADTSTLCFAITKREHFNFILGTRFLDQLRTLAKELAPSQPETIIRHEQCHIIVIFRNDNHPTSDPLKWQNFLPFRLAKSFHSQLESMIKQKFPSN